MSCEYEIKKIDEADDKWTHITEGEVFSILKTSGANNEKERLLNGEEVSIPPDKVIRKRPCPK